MKNYWKPTPAKWRKLGDAMLAGSIYAQTQQAITGHTTLLTVISIMGVIGKILTNFFGPDEKPSQN